MSTSPDLKVLYAFLGSVNPEEVAAVEAALEQLHLHRERLAAPFSIPPTQTAAIVLILGTNVPSLELVNATQSGLPIYAFSSVPQPEFSLHLTHFSNPQELQARIVEVLLPLLIFAPPASVPWIKPEPDSLERFPVDEAPAVKQREPTHYKLDRVRPPAPASKGSDGFANWDFSLPIPSPPASAPTTRPDPGFQIVRVFYATDRQLKSGPAFANERSAPAQLSYGTCNVTIPNTDAHTVGELESPSIWKFELKENPRKHVILAQIETLLEQEFLQQLRNRIGATTSRDAFVFIHGYKVSFEDAARRTAQFAYDLNFKGAPIFYSWPSGARWWRYAADEANVQWTVSHLEGFLLNIAQHSGAQQIHLIAHSMGNRALTWAMQLLAAKKVLPKGLFRQIVLTAPDIDAETFDQLVLAMSTEAERITMYSNYKDVALLVSRLFHFYQRAGASVRLVPGMETIDATKVDTSLLKHSYFGGSRTVLADLAALLLDGKPAKDRFGMKEKITPQGSYFVFRP
jgi:esterase/lipase superfamily enzyme